MLFKHIRDIAAAKATGYDGVYNRDKCSCLFNKFAPCGQSPSECSLGVKNEKSTCDADRVIEAPLRYFKAPSKGKRYHAAIEVVHTKIQGQNKTHCNAKIRDGWIEVSKEEGANTACRQCWSGMNSRRDRGIL